MLLERPGEIVTREEIQKKLWPTDTFVEFDHSINAAIQRLRQALGDSAENPRFVETMARRGYRFVYPVAAALDREIATAPAKRRSSLRWLLAVAAAVIMAALVGYLLTRPLPPPKVVSSVQITKDGQAKSPPVLTDGSRLFYMGVAANGFALYQVSIAGGEAVALSTPFFIANLVSMSPDGAELLVQASEGTLREGPLWIFPSLAGPSHRLGSVLSSDAAWSPDGKALVYAKGHDLYVARRDGTESRKLVTVPGNPSWIRWSPDQKVLRFTSWEPKTSSPSLWEVSAEGTNLHALLPDWNNPPRRMLRHLDTRREILLIPVNALGQNGYLGYSRKRKPSPQTPSSANPVDSRASEFLWTRLERRRQAPLRDRCAAARRARPLRRQIRAVRTLSFGNLG